MIECLVESISEIELGIGIEYSIKGCVCEQLIL